MPLVVLEAMQWNVPIVATAVGAIPDLLAHGQRGVLVAPGNVEALATALQGIPDAAAGGSVELAAAAVSGHYTSARMEREYSAAYGAIA